MARCTPWCFGTGVLLFHVLPRMPGATWCAACAALAIVCFSCSRARWLLPCILGFAWTWLHVDQRLAERWPARSREAVLLEGVVAEADVEDPRVRRFEIDADVVDGRARALRARLAWYDAKASPQVAERWRLRARLRAPRGFANPGGFDYEGWLFREGIAATGYVVEDAANARLEGADENGLLGLRGHIARRLDTIPGETAHPGIVTALAVGLTHGIRAEDWETLRATGTTHLISISGLHIGLVAGAAAWLARRGCGFGRRRWLAPVDAAALCGLVAAIAYAALAGFSIPTLRALLMLAVVLARSLLRRHGPAEGPLAQAFAAVLAVDPLAPLFPGFWLSFLAVAALPLGVLGGYRGLTAHLRTQCAVTLVVAPLTLAVFGSVSLIAPLVNLVYIPIYSLLVVPGVLLGVVLLPFGDAAATLPLELAAGAIDLSWPWLERAAQWPIALWTSGPRPAWVLLGAEAALLLCVAPRGWPGRWLSLPLALPLLLWRPPAPAEGAFEVAVLDVGQGLAVVVRTARHALLYDAGPAFRSGGDAGRSVVVPYLHDRGVRALDLLVLSHDDVDHRGGVPSVREQVPVGATLTGGAGDGEPCVAGRRWRWDGVDFALLHPQAGERWPDNDGSCVLRVSARGGSVLLAGDIEEAAERALAARGITLASDIVVAPHHGSASSSSAAFVAAVQARDVVYSVGHDNRWGFPRAIVEARWRAAGARTWSTAEAGAVTFVVDPHSGVSAPLRHRLDERRYWTAP
jgi:competence protein ComEC